MSASFPLNGGHVAAATREMLPMRSLTHRRLSPAPVLWCAAVPAPVLRVRALPTAELRV